MKEIKLNEGKVAIVDDEDYERLMAMGKWRLNKAGYVFRSLCFKNQCGKWSTKGFWLHRDILNPPKDMVIDHINGDKLDNRKCNLRICKQAENNRNTKVNKTNKIGLKGVSKRSTSKNYYARIMVNRKYIYLGDFTCPVEAARAYNAAAIKYHREFAKLNQI